MSLAAAVAGETCSRATISLRANAGKEFLRYSYWLRATSLLVKEIMESFSSFSTMTPSMGAHRAAWTNTATEAMPPLTTASQDPEYDLARNADGVVGIPLALAFGMDS